MWGYLAGWSFVVGKTASCAAMALTVGFLRLAVNNAHEIYAVAAVVGANRGGELLRCSEIGVADAGNCRCCVSAVLAAVGGGGIQFWRCGCGSASS